MSTDFLVAHRRTRQRGADRARLHDREAARRRRRAASCTPAHRAAPVAAHRDRLRARPRGAGRLLRRAGPRRLERARPQHVRSFAAHEPRRGPRAAQHPAPAVGGAQPLPLPDPRRRAARTNPRRTCRRPRRASACRRRSTPTQMARLLEFRSRRRASACATRRSWSCSTPPACAWRNCSASTSPTWTCATARCASWARAARRASCPSAARRVDGARSAGCRSARRSPRVGETAVFVGRNGRASGPRIVQLRIAQLGPPAGPAASTSIRTCSGTRSPRTCSSHRRTCAACRNCSATPTSARPRSTRTLISSTWPASTTMPTRGRSASAPLA